MVNLEVSYRVEEGLGSLLRRFKDRRRLYLLGIDRDVLMRCQTLDELRAIAKQTYRKAMRYAHPDTRGMYHGKRRIGATVQTLNDAYKWFLSLKEEDLIRGHERLRSVPEVPLPLDWSGWPVQTPIGFQESFDHLRY